jgi:hypothetical protein
LSGSGLPRGKKITAGNGGSENEDAAGKMLIRRGKQRAKMFRFSQGIP